MKQTTMEENSQYNLANKELDLLSFLFSSVDAALSGNDLNQVYNLINSIITKIKGDKRIENTEEIKECNQLLNELNKRKNNYQNYGQTPAAYSLYHNSINKLYQKLTKIYHKYYIKYEKEKKYESHTWRLPTWKMRWNS